MCGIAGVFAYHERSPLPDPAVLRRLSGVLRRRGPDASGQWCSANHRLLLAHRRLSIIGLNTAGNQPMVDKATNCVVVFNGEIYNFRELRQTLQRVGHVFRSDGDTEVLLRGYLHWGDAVLTRLRGMFAFALWDARLQTLLLVRDPYGIKPLYYTDQCGCCAFASQVRPLREHFVPDNEPDPAGLVGFLLLGSVPEPYSSYRAIRAVPAGYVVRISSSGCALPVPYASVGKVWADAAERPERLGAVALLERVRSAVRGSVSAHRVADVPVGAFLSAGIDSGAVVGLMAEDSSAVVQTVTLGFRDFQGGAQNEVFHAEEVALRYGTRQ